MPKLPLWVFGVLALFLASAVRIDIMDIDASQYAEISREMMESGSYLQIFDRGRDYLDKPPFLFWISALGMKLFGVNNFGYKFPSILFALWGIYATYRLGRLLYGEAAGRMAAFILGTCQAMFLMTNDIRTDTVLTSWVITALWMIREAERTRKWYYVLGGTLSLACGMMSKGPIALFVPIFAFGFDWFMRRDWKRIFSPYHLLDVVLVALFLIPMSWGLYQQFDAQPEKIIHGEQGVSGLRFFYWSQSFGRITGESPWDNGAGLDFLFVNMLWAFLPWILVFVPAILYRSFQLFRQRFRALPGQEWLSFGGFVLSYFALGLSRYQLPHYLFVVYPLAAILVAAFLKEAYEQGMHKGFLRWFRPTAMVVGALIWGVVAVLLFWVFPSGIRLWPWWILALGLWLWFITHPGIKPRAFWALALAIIGANLSLTHHFYYELMKYQVGNQVGRYIQEEGIDPSRLGFQQIHDPLNSLHYYSQHPIPELDPQEESLDRIRKYPYRLMGEEGYHALLEQGASFDLLKTGPFFKVSELTPAFLDPRTREHACDRYYLIHWRIATDPDT